MSDVKKLHPISIVFTFFRLLKDLLIPLAFSAVALFRDLNFETIWIRISVLVCLFAFLVLYSFITWYRYTYRIEDNELRIVYGVFVKKQRFISINRIQSIDLSAGPLHRMFGLVRVEVQTAGSSLGPEAGLKAVSKEEGERLRAELHAQPADPIEAEEKGQVKGSVLEKRISLPVLLLAATTSGGIGVFLSVFTIAGSQVNQLIPDDFFYGIYQWIVATSVVLLFIFGFIGLLLLWLMAIAGIILKYNDFTIARFPDEVRISRGLLEKKQVTIPLKRVQAVRVQENLLRQPFGYAAVYAEVAGGSADQAEDFSTVLFPLIKKEELPQFLTEYMPDYHLVEEWKRLPRRAARRFISRALFFPVLSVLPLLYFFMDFWWIAGAILAGAVFLGYWRYKDAGTAAEGEEFAIQTRVFSREIVLVKRKRIQSFSTSAHFFQQRAGLQTIHFAVASRGGTGKGFGVKDMDQDCAGKFLEWYSFENRQRGKQVNDQPSE